MDKVRVSELAKRFVDATVGMTGTDEEALFDVIKEVYAEGARSRFTKEAERAVGDERKAALLKKTGEESIVRAIFRDELSGSELKRAEDYFEKGRDTSRATKSELFTEGALDLFDLSSVSKEVGAGVAAAAIGGAIYFFPAKQVVAVAAVVLLGAAVVAGVMKMRKGAGAGEALAAGTDGGDADVQATQKDSYRHELFEKRRADAKAKLDKIQALMDAYNKANPANVAKIEYRGVLFSQDDCFEKIVGGDLTIEDDYLTVILKRLLDCETENGRTGLASYYEGMMKQIAASGAPDVIAKRYRMLGEAEGSPAKALEFFSESINRHPDNNAAKNDTIRDGIVVGVMNDLIPETKDFISNAVDSLEHLYQQDYVNVQDINRAFLESQREIGGLFAQAGGDAKKREIDDLYKYMMKEKYRLLCEQGYQYRSDYCDYFVKNVLPAFELDCMYLDKDCKLPK